jgi:hypothetical protein
VALRALLHVAGLGGPAAVQPRPIAPFGIELNAIGRVSDHELGFAITQEVSHNIGARRIAAEYPVLAADPQIA